MPQMFRYCGQTLTVYKRAHKTCDTVNPIRGARVHDAVHLDVRCDGAAYGGCQAACLIFWKTAWLSPVSESEDAAVRADDAGGPSRTRTRPGCTETTVSAATQVLGPDGQRYVCQATQLPSFTTTLPWWDFRQYLEDYTSGNVTLRQLLHGLVYASYASAVQAGIGLGPPLRWLYDRFSSPLGNTLYPRSSGTIPVGQPTPTSILNLQPGDLVRVKSHRAILATLDTEAKNRGLSFDREMVPYCGGTYRVKARVTTIVDERSGRLLTINSPALLLEDVTCQARYSDCRMFCPRSIYPWWRETWLERVQESPSGPSPRSLESACSKHTDGSSLRR
jgi:hypothetical protein